MRASLVSGSLWSESDSKSFLWFGLFSCAFCLKLAICWFLYSGGLLQAYSSFSNSSMLESLFRISGLGERDYIFSGFAVVGRYYWVPFIIIAFLPPPDFRNGLFGFTWSSSMSSACIVYYLNSYFGCALLNGSWYYLWVWATVLGCSIC